MIDKKTTRIRRSRQTRLHIYDLGVNRLSVHRTNTHMYAAVYTCDGAKVIASASTLDVEVKAALSGATGSNVSAAAAVGNALAKRAIAKGVDKVAFDRSGFQFHGRVKALAEAARAAGLKF